MAAKVSLFKNILKNLEHSSVEDAGHFFKSFGLDDINEVSKLAEKDIRKINSEYSKVVNKEFTGKDFFKNQVNSSKSAGRANAEKVAGTAEETIEEVAEEIDLLKENPDLSGVGKYVEKKIRPDLQTMQKQLNMQNPNETIMKNIYNKVKNQLPENMRGEGGFEAFSNLNAKDKMAYANAWKEYRTTDGVNFMDKMGHHKVPQKAAAIGTTAWLVSKMSDSKGQMSNGQLYGQQSPYGY